MKIVAQYSHKAGREYLEKNRLDELKEIEKIITSVKASAFKTKVSEEKTMMGKALYSPKELNAEFKRQLEANGWKPHRLRVTTTIPEIGQTHEGFREIDGVKNGVGVEIQFGKYAFMIYNGLAKMTIFANQKVIDSGIEIVPMLSLAREMSTGVSYYEQMKTDLEYRGESDIDIPVLIIGVNDEERG